MTTHHQKKACVAALVAILAGAADLQAQGATDSTTAIPVDTATTPAATVAPSPPALVSWTSDRRGFVTGDILTVFVDERTLAAAVADDYAREDRRFGRNAAIMGSRYGVRLDGDASSDDRGRSQRDERFVTEISVRVMEQVGNVLRVEGRKQLRVDDHQQEVILRGFLRPEDVSGINVIEGWRIADLEMLYESNGELIKADKGMLQRLLGIVF